MEDVHYEDTPLGDYFSQFDHDLHSSQDSGTYLQGFLNQNDDQSGGYQRIIPSKVDSDKDVTPETILIINEIKRLQRTKDGFNFIPPFKSSHTRNKSHWFGNLTLTASATLSSTVLFLGGPLIASLILIPTPLILIYRQIFGARQNLLLSNLEQFILVSHQFDRKTHEIMKTIQESELIACGYKMYFQTHKEQRH